MKAGMATAICISPLLILFHFCDGVNGDVYYGIAKGSLWNEKESGYYDGPRANFKGASCDLKHRVGHKETFPIHGFPPEPQQQKWPYQYWTLPMPPEQCIWEFGTRHGDDCVLEFHTHYFQRGDINCEQQYLLIGDEYGEQRVCGFIQPPARFVSSGRKLYLSHYRRNGNIRTLSSRIRGAVHCVKHPRGYGYSEDVGGAYTYSSDSNTGCAPTKEPTCSLIDAAANVGLDEFAFAPAVLRAPPSPAVAFPDLEFLCQNSKGCVEQTQVCFQSSPVGVNVTVLAGNPFTSGSGVHCRNESAVCGQAGSCQAVVTQVATGTGIPPAPSLFNCTVATDCICTFSIAFCIKDK